MILGLIWRPQDRNHFCCRPSLHHKPWLCWTHREHPFVCRARFCPSNCFHKRVFHKLHKNANIDIRGFTTWKQKIQWQNVTHRGPLITSDSKCVGPHYPFWVRHVLLRSLNFCWCTTWFLDLIQLESIEHDYIRSLKSQSYKQMPS